MAFISVRNLIKEAVCEYELRSMSKVRPRGADGLVIRCEHVLVNHLIGRYEYRVDNGTSRGYNSVVRKIQLK